MKPMKYLIYLVRTIYILLVFALGWFIIFPSLIIFSLGLAFTTQKSPSIFFNRNYDQFELSVYFRFDKILDYIKFGNSL